MTHETQNRRRRAVTTHICTATVFICATATIAVPPPDSGSIYLYNKEFVQAARWYSGAVDTSRALSVHRGYQDGCLALGGTTLDSCRTRYRNLATRNKDNSFYNYLYGRVLDCTAGRPWFDRALAQKPCDPLALNALGACAFERGDFHSALDNFGHSIKCDPSYTEAYNNLAQVYIREKQITRAKEVFRKLALYNRESPDLYDWLGDLYLSQNEFALAFKSYSRSMEKGKNGPAIAFKAGYAGFKLNDYRSAAVYYAKSIEAGNRRYEVYYNLGVSQDLAGQPADAIENYEHAYAISQDYRLLYPLGNCAVNAGLYSKAIRWYRGFLEHDQRNTDGLFGLANAYQMKRDFDNAIDTYHQILAIDSNYAKAYYNLGSIYAYHIKNRQEMRKYWGKYIFLFPHNEDTGYLKAEMAKMEKAK